MTESSAKPRKIEKVWMWLFFGTALFYILSLFAEWVHLNLGALVAIVIFVIAILFVLLKEKKPASFVDALEACADVQFEHNGETVPTSIKDAEVVPDGPNWIVFFWKTSAGWPVAFRYDPEKRSVIGREINDYEAILKRFQENEFLKEFNRQAMQRRIKKEEEERRGIDTSEDEPT
jgi:hypothetical protein